MLIIQFCITGLIKLICCIVYNDVLNYCWLANFVKETSHLTFPMNCFRRFNIPHGAIPIAITRIFDLCRLLKSGKLNCYFNVEIHWNGISYSFLSTKLDPFIDPLDENNSKNYHKNNKIVETRKSKNQKHLRYWLGVSKKCQWAFSKVTFRIFSRIPKKIVLEHLW